MSYKQMIQEKQIKRADAMKIALDNIHEEPGFNLRQEGEDLQASIEALCAHILDGGMLPALEVREREEGGVWVVDGHRRRRAFIMARDKGAPIEFINIVAFTGNDLDRLTRIMTSAEGRALSPLETAQGYKKLSAYGLSSDDIAQRIKKSRTQVDNMLLLANAPHAVHSAIQSGDISGTEAIKTIRQHKEKAGAVIAAAKATSGKKKVTAKVLKPSKEKEPKSIWPDWTHVEDGLPEIEKDVLCQLDINVFCVGQSRIEDGNKVWVDCEGSILHVVYWMELPPLAFT